MQPQRVTPPGVTPAGPYVPAVVVGNLVFVSGQLPANPQDGRIVAGSVREQTERALANLELTLQAAGSSLDHIVKATVYLARIEDWQEMSDAYGARLGTSLPARSAVGVGLPPGVYVEIEAIAYVP